MTGTPDAIARAERGLTQVIVSLKVWAARERTTVRGAEARELLLRAEAARQEVVSLAGPPARKSVAPSLRRSVLHDSDYRCATCGCDLRASGVAVHIDHVVPVARYGVTRRDNLQALCGPCNLAKGAR